MKLSVDPPPSPSNASGSSPRQRSHNDPAHHCDRAGFAQDALCYGSEAQLAYRRAQASGKLSPDLQAFAGQRLR